jgi:dsRNA-specific ribonuclease
MSKEKPMKNHIFLKRFRQFTTLTKGKPVNMGYQNSKTQLMEYFHLSDDEELFKQAIHPKSCGGGHSFKFFALIGDIILNLVLLEIISNNEPMDTGELTEAIQAIHNKQTLIRIAQHLKLPFVMENEFETHCFSDNDLKEGIEALLGATYRTKGIDSCKQIISNLTKIARINDYLNPNPIGILQILFQKRNLPLPVYHSVRTGGPDHKSRFQCTVKGNYEGKKIELKSSIHLRKKDAEKDAARQFLKELGEERKLDVFQFLNQENNL